MSFENINLFENLASHGYVVACITSVGTYPGNMSMKKNDLMEQVGDGAFAIQLLKNKNNTDSNQIGSMGYSWGGLAAWILSQKQKDIKAVLSWMVPKCIITENQQRRTRISISSDRSFFHPGTKRSFGICLPGKWIEAGRSDRLIRFLIFFFIQDIRNNISVFAKAKHEDFSCLPFLAADISQSKNSSAELYSLIQPDHPGFF